MNTELKKVADKKYKSKAKMLNALIGKGVMTNSERTWYEVWFNDGVEAIEPSYESMKIKQQLPTENMAVKLYLLMSGYNPEDFNPNGAYVKHLKQSFRDAVEIITNKNKEQEK